MGQTVNFKTYKSSFKDKYRKSNPQSERVVFDDTHEAIIDRETWETANRIRQRSIKRVAKGETAPSLFSGILYCADCGRKLHVERALKSDGSKREDYVCAANRKMKTQCTPHRVNAETLTVLILETLRTVAAEALADEKEFTLQVNAIYAGIQAESEKELRRKLATGRQRHAELDKLIKRLYEDYVVERITAKRFDMLTAEYEQEQEQLAADIAELQTRVAELDDSYLRAERFLQLTHSYTDFSELTPSMLNEFVEKIVVHERAHKNRKINSQKVEIHLNFIGNLSSMQEQVLARPDPGGEGRERLRAYFREYYHRRKANDGKPLTPADTRCKEEKVVDEATRLEKKRAYHREYQRALRSKRRRAKREAWEAAMVVPVVAAPSAVAASSAE